MIDYAIFLSVILFGIVIAMAMTIWIFKRWYSHPNECHNLCFMWHICNSRFHYRKTRSYTNECRSCV